MDIAISLIQLYVLAFVVRIFKILAWVFRAVATSIFIAIAGFRVLRRK